MGNVLHKWLFILQQRLWAMLDEWGFVRCLRALLGLFAVLAVLMACCGADRIHAIKSGLQAQTKALQHQSRENARLAKTLRLRKAQSKRFSRGMDRAGNTKTWLEAMQSSLRIHHLQLETLQMKPIKRTQGYVKHPFCLRAKAPYRDVKAWLWRWSAKPYPGTVSESVQLERAPKRRVRMEVCGAYYQRR